MRLFTYIVTLMLSLLFLCTANAARSQLAEALVNQRYAEHFIAFSAGTQPKGVDPRSIQLLKQQNLSASKLYSKTIDQLLSQRLATQARDSQAETQFDFIITLCDSAKQQCVNLPSSKAMMHWNLADPAASAGMDKFAEVFTQLEQLISEFVRFNQPIAEQLQLSPIDVFKQLSDNTRLQILMLIEDEQCLSVNQLSHALAESQPKVSRHLALLRDCQLVATTRQGQQIFYHLHPCLPAWVTQTLATTRLANPSYINLPLFRLRALQLEVPAKIKQTTKPMSHSLLVNPQ
ncbi:metalloregulator ArsR/SmtB family transcription factor [Agarivorans sp. Z349TD_8]|uniref:metalloregulator ArsR/SmtB family transcription factor n=1 Tax=Agarivorans sp. Z349TD_8 TaxID=3421434 RepID=UPI003D7CE932